MSQPRIPYFQAGHGRERLAPLQNYPSPSAVILQLLETMVFLGGGRLREVVQNSLVLFDGGLLAPETMAIRVSEISADKIRSAIKKQQEVEAEFQTFAEKACTRIFRQFSGSAK